MDFFLNLDNRKWNDTDDFPEYVFDTLLKHHTCLID